MPVLHCPCLILEPTASLNSECTDSQSYNTLLSYLSGIWTRTLIVGGFRVNSLWNLFLVLNFQLESKMFCWMLCLKTQALHFSSRCTLRKTIFYSLCLRNTQIKPSSLVYVLGISFSNSLSRKLSVFHCNTKVKLGNGLLDSFYLPDYII